MKYLQFTFHLTPPSDDASDVLCALLGEADFDSFEHEAGTDTLRAYVRKDLFSPAALDAALAAFPFADVQLSYEQADAEDRNWNEVWEQNYFQPLVVDGECVIHSTFHTDYPRARFNITIDPRMSFGTGHHATTSQMVSEILHHDLRGLSVLDMGCGTSILAILARMCGAASCVAIDNDEWCVRNSADNIRLNGVDGIDVRLGDASLLPAKPTFDFILANINRNILLSDMARYAACLRPGGSLLMSGFYREDVDLLRDTAQKLGLCFVKVRDRDRWACMELRKS